MTNDNDAFRRTPEGEGVRRLKGVGEVTDHAELRAAARDWQRYSSDLLGDNDVRDYKQLPLEVDPPEHGAYRRIIEPIFERQRILSLEPRFREVASRLVEGFLDAGKADAVSDIALPMVVESIAIALGRTQDLDEYLSWGEDAWELPDGTRDGSRLHRYLDRVFDEVTANPGAGDDAFTAISQGRVDNRPLSRIEMTGYGSVLLTGGRDTVINLISGAIWHLARDHAARRVLADDHTRLSTAIEELVRFLSPLPAMERKATEHVSGTWGEARSGDIVLLGFAKANHDRSVFAEADKIDLERSPNRHLGFGNGPHTCIGLHLARVETRVLLEELLRSVPDWRIAGAPAVTFGVFGESRVPVSFRSIPIEVGTEA